MIDATTVGRELSADDLVHIIENDPQAFLEGRRNNDLVNWFLAKRISSLEMTPVQPNNYRMSQELQLDFDEISLNADQGDDLLYCWEETVEKKLVTLVKKYGMITDARTLWSLWIPIDYQLGPNVSEAQEALQLD